MSTKYQQPNFVYRMIANAIATIVIICSLHVFAITSLGLDVGSTAIGAIISAILTLQVSRGLRERAKRP